MQVFLILISISCGKTSEELGRIKGISNELLIELGVYPKTTKEDLLYRQVTLLLNYLEQRNCNFSAAGFLNVNYNLLYVTCGCAASYIVLCLQFY